jgi:hypothetical protein
MHSIVRFPLRRSLLSGSYGIGRLGWSLSAIMGGRSAHVETP